MVKTLLWLGLVLTLAFSTASPAAVKVASFSIVTTELAQKIGGEHVSVADLIPPDTDPHEYQPTPAHLRRVSESQLVLIPGQELGGYTAKLRQATGPDHLLVSVAEKINSNVEGAAKSIDPHWWHSVALVKRAAGVIRDAFIQLDPAHQADYEENAGRYLAELNELEQWIKRRVAELPRDKRKLVTSHDAFQYFALEYGFRIYSVEGVSTEAQPSSRHAATLIDLIKAEGVKAIFLESTLNPKVIREITRETGATVGGTLYADGLGSGDASTYAGMMRHNVSTIVDALKN